MRHLKFGGQVFGGPSKHHVHAQVGCQSDEKTIVVDDLDIWQMVQRVPKQLSSRGKAEHAC
jgi:hypothetical protein